MARWLVGWQGVGAAGKSAGGALDVLSIYM